MPRRLLPVPSLQQGATNDSGYPGGLDVQGWLEAFNSGDRALLDAYHHKYDPSKSLDNEMQFRRMTGGFNLLQIVKSEINLEFRK